MGILDDLLAGGGGNGGIGAALNDLLKGGGGAGGLDGILAKFNQAGLGDLVKGWIANGANGGIDAGQLEQVFGQGQLRDLAAKFGLPIDDLLGGLGKILPDVVDKATPDGAIPSNDPLKGGLEDLLGSVLRKG